MIKGLAEVIEFPTADLDKSKNECDRTEYDPVSFYFDMVNSSIKYNLEIFNIFLETQQKFNPVFIPTNSFTGSYFRNSLRASMKRANIVGVYESKSS